MNHKRYIQDAIRIFLLFGALVIGGCILMLELAHPANADPLPFRTDQYIPPVVTPQPKCGPEIHEYVGNLGPNTQTSGSPANPVVQSIHPK